MMPNVVPSTNFSIAQSHNAEIKHSDKLKIAMRLGRYNGRVLV